MKIKNAKLGDIAEAVAAVVIIGFASHAVFIEGRSLTELEIVLLFAGLGAVGMDGNGRELLKGDASGPRE